MPFRIRRQGVTRMPDALAGAAAAQADFDLSSTNFVFNAVEGDPDPSPQFLLVANVGTGTFAGPTLGTPIYLSGSGWLTVSAAGGLPGSATIAVTTGSLVAGVYSARFYVTDSNTVDSPAMVGVTFVVAAAPQPPILSVGGSSFVFTASVGDPNTAIQTLTVSNIGGGSFAGPAVGNVVYGPGATGWLAGSINGLTISGYAKPAGISSGNYTATFDVTDANASNSPLTVPVAFNVSAVAPATMSFSPGLQLNFTAVQGGANPATQQAIITNVGGGTLAACAAGAITYGSGSGWITSITFGGSGNSQTMTVLLATGALTPATYTATFPVTSAGASNTPQTFTISFVVTAVTPPGNFPAPKYTMMQGISSNATFDTSTNVITYNPFTNNGITDPDGDSTSPGYYYAGATALTASSLANLNTHCATAAANPTIKYVITLDTSFSTGTRWTLPAKSGTLFTMIKQSVALPTAEVDRPVAADFASAKKITYTGTTYAITLAAGSDGWHFRDMYIENGSATELGALFNWGYPDDALNSGNGQTNTADMPERFKMERCYLNNPFNNSTRYCARLLVMGGRFGYILRNRLEGGCKNSSSDSQGILLSNGLGDYKIEDNFIEGASENILAGGGRVWMGSQNYNHNIHIVGNHLYKRTAWLTNVTGANNGSTVWAQIKNLFELKQGRYVVFEDNYLENHNGAAQQVDIAIKVSPYAAGEVNYLRTNDVTIRNNYSTNGMAAMELSNGDDHSPNPSTTNFTVGRIELRNNAFVNRFTTSSSLLKNIIGGFATATKVMTDLTIDHNFFSDTNSFIYFTPSPAVCITSLFVTNNIWFNAINPTQSSVIGTGVSPNKAALNAFCSTTGWTFSKNAGVSATSQAQLYGSGASSLAIAPYSNIRFASSGTPGGSTSGSLGAQLNTDRSVKTSSTSLHNTGTDGKDIGPDWTQLVKAMSANT